MSKKSRILRTARSELSADTRPVTKLSGPGDAIAMIPYLLGFTPSESLVVIALEGPRKRFGPCFRMDLVEDAEDVADQADYVLALVRHHHFDPVMIFAFSEQREPAEAMLHAVEAKLSTAEVGMLDAIRADGSRWWSMSCSDPRCCGPAGVRYDVDTSRVAAEAVLAGMQRAPDRDSLRAQFAPLSRDRVDAVAEAAARMQPRASPAPLITAALHNPSNLTVERIAELAVAVQQIRGRDEAWAMMTRANAERHLRLWRAVMQSVPDALLPPVGALAAFAAWLSGNGVLASHAAERVVGVDESYSMATLVIDALRASLNPNTWDTFRSDTGLGAGQGGVAAADKARQAGA